MAQVRDRRLGAQLATAGISEIKLVMISTPGLDLASGIAAASELSALPDAERPTAAFEANDLVAIGLLQGLVTSGIRVPEDVAIIGFDDIAFAAAAAVPLSSVRQPRQQMGERAVELLFAEIQAQDNQDVHLHQQLSFLPELVARRSTVARHVAVQRPRAARAGRH